MPGQENVALYRSPEHSTLDLSSKFSSGSVSLVQRLMDGGSKYMQYLANGTDPVSRPVLDPELRPYPRYNVSTQVLAVWDERFKYDSIACPSVQH